MVVFRLIQADDLLIKRLVHQVHVAAHMLHLPLGLGHQLGHVLTGRADQLLDLGLGTHIQGKFQGALDVALGVLDRRPGVL